MNRTKTLCSAIALCLMNACGGHDDENAGASFAAPKAPYPYGNVDGNWSTEPGRAGIGGGGGDNPYGTGSAAAPSCATGGSAGDTAIGGGTSIGGDPGTSGGGDTGSGGVSGIGGDTGIGGSTTDGNGGAPATGGVSGVGGAAQGGEAGGTAVDPTACRHSVDVCLAQYDDCIAFGDTGCLHIIDVCAALARDCN